MVNDAQQEPYSDQITQFVHDFIQLDTRFKAFFPEELARLKDRLDQMSPKGEAHPAANYELFYRVSGILYRRSNLTMGELSSALSVPLSTATRMVDWLVDNGYAQRLPDPDDRRIVRVALTDSGRRLHEAAESYIAQRVQQILSPLTAEERSTLLALFHKVAIAFKARGR